MDELINAIATATGVTPQRTRQATGIILSFLSREAPPDAAGALLDCLPGSRELAAETGGGKGGLMGLFGELTGAGLGIGDIQAVASELISYARAKAGATKVDAVIGAIPGLGQFL